MASQDSFTKVPVDPTQLFGVRKISCQVVHHPFQSFTENLVLFCSWHSEAFQSFSSLIIPPFNKHMCFTHITVQMSFANCNWPSLVIWHLASPSCDAEIFQGLLSHLCCSRRVSWRDGKQLELTLGTQLPAVAIFGSSFYHKHTGAGQGHFGVLEIFIYLFIYFYLFFGCPTWLVRS